MRERKNLWNEEDTAKARILIARNAPPEDFMSEIKRTKGASKSRIEYLDNPNCRDRKYESVRRSRLKCLDGPTEPPRRYTTRAAGMPIPEHVLADAAARSNAPRTLSAMLLGDPPIGFSALDRRS